MTQETTVLDATVTSLGRAAHRHGKIGWNVGRRIEVASHYRRPHMALIWKTEKNHTRNRTGQLRLRQAD